MPAYESIFGGVLVGLCVLLMSNSVDDSLRMRMRMRMRMGMWSGQTAHDVADNLFANNMTSS